jgi:hypothetical protein
LGKLKLCVFGFNSFIDVAEHLDENLKCVKSKRVFFLRCDYVLMFTFLKFALSNFRQRVYSSLKDVLLGKIAIIVNENFEKVLRILTQLVKDIQD